MAAQIHFHFYDPNIAARAKIDEEIAQLEARIRSLRVARNALSSIARLQPEILQEIFCFVLEGASNPKGKSALLITWVSHQWRDLGHNTSALWSHIDFTHVEWVTTALSRTKDHELEFDIKTTKSDSATLETLLSLILGNVRRMKKLKVSRHGQDGMGYREGAVEWLSPAPVLKELLLDGFDIPRNLFSGTLPRLQSLHLERYTAQLSGLPVVRGLKSLYLGSPEIPFPFEVLMNVFRVIGPQLESLELHHTFALDDPNMPPPDYPSRFRFENLKFLRLLQTAEEIALLFDHTFLPNRLDVEIGIQDWVEASMLQSLISCRDISGRWPAECLEINLEGHFMHLNILENWLSGDTHSGGLGNNMTHINLGIEFLVTVPSIILQIFNFLPIQPIEKVDFSSGTGLDYTQDPLVLDYIGKLGTVRELRIEVSFWPTFVKSVRRQEIHIISMIAELEADNPDTPAEVSDSALLGNFISFHNLRSVEIYDGQKEPYTVSCTSEDLQVLQTWLERRKRLGLQLERLSMIRLKTWSIGWMGEIFDGVVDEFQTSDIQEEAWDHSDRDLFPVEN